jgi:integrase
MKAEVHEDADEKLCNFEEKLCNSKAASGDKPAEGIMTDRWYDEDGNMHIDMPFSEVAPEDWGALEWDEKDDPYMFKAEARFREALKREKEAEKQSKDAKAKRNLSFTKDELHQYTDFRIKGIAPKSRYWIFQSAEALWASTHGEISQNTLDTLRNNVLEKYGSRDSHSKMLGFAKSFLERLATTRGEPRYQTFTPYLKLPKALRERRIVTRIVTAADIKNILEYIKHAESAGQISPERSAQYSAIVLFGAYTGQRSEATISKLTVGQFRKAMSVDTPTLLVDSSQDKIRKAHYVPLHPRVVEVLKPLLAGRDDDELMFMHSSFLQWIKRQKIPMSRFEKHFALGDLRKFAEQHGDNIEWTLSNRFYILTHDVSRVRDEHYLHPLPESVYDIYMKYWKEVDLTI